MPHPLRVGPALLQILHIGPRSLNLVLPRPAMLPLPLRGHFAAVGAGFQHGEEVLVPLGATGGPRVARVHLRAQEVGILHAAGIEPPPAARPAGSTARAAGALESTLT